MPSFFSAESTPQAADACAAEPIHLIGQTQSHGFLIALSEPDFIVRHVSANVFDLVAGDPDEVLGQSLERLLGSAQFRALGPLLRAVDLVVSNPLDVRLGRPDQQLECFAHRHDGMLLLELKPRAGAYSLRPLNFANHLQGPIARMELPVDIDELAAVAAREFHRASGFERVMIYRFDAQWNGHVIAEVGGAWPSYLGHHFPATDIPAQARRLFLINTLRSIADVESPPIPIVPTLDPRNGRPLDLSRSLLRSPSPVHIQYLRNMGVRSTMTISLIVRGELWGMVTAHHSTPHRLDFLTRSVCALLAQILAAQIVARADNALLEERLKSREGIEAYMTSIEQHTRPGSVEGFDLAPLLALLHVDGAIAHIDGDTALCGTTAQQGRLMPIIAILRGLAVRGIASSNMLSALDPSAEAYAHEASGALYLGLSESSDDSIVLLRRELVQTIVWAGDPNKFELADGKGQSLSPRTSFASWLETVRGCSRPWTELELENARLLREQFISGRLKHLLRQRERQYRQERARSTLFQQAVLPPRLPTVAGLLFDAVYETGLSNELVGGDWYDAVRLIDGRVLVTIGDVAGSGLDAAVIMGVVRQIMRGIAQLHPEPALLLDAADRALRLEYPEVFVTAWVGVFDLVARTLTYASAGHPPPLLLEATGGIRELDHRTLPIGLRQGHQGHASTIAISHGSFLCLYTDGLIEATHNIVEGCRRLSETVLRLGAARVAHPAAAIRRLVIPDGSSDDVAILVVSTNFDESERFLTRSRFDSADAFSARKARRQFAASLSSKSFSENDIANAEVVFGELCGNVARYAPGIVDVVVDRSGLQTVLHILDRGAGFRHFSRLPADPLAEQGRGLFIIASMTAEFTVTQRVGGGSHARAVLVGRYPRSLLLDESLPAVTDQVSASF